MRNEWEREQVRIGQRQRQKKGFDKPSFWVGRNKRQVRSRMLNSLVCLFGYCCSRSCFILLLSFVPDIFFCLCSSAPPPLSCPSLRSYSFQISCFCCSVCPGRRIK